MSKRRPLNLKRYRTGDLVQHYRTGVYYRLSGLVIRSECKRWTNLETGEVEIHHPRMFDPVENPLTVLALESLEPGELEGRAELLTVYT